MAVLGTLLSRAIKLGNLPSGSKAKSSPFLKQKKALYKLLKTARNTEFGKHYNFSEILGQFDNSDPKAFYAYFTKRVPVYSYNKIYEEWWRRSRDGEKNITWPGAVKYFALSSGTSESTSKYIPITEDMIRSNRRTGVKQLLTLVNYDLPKGLLGKGILMLGGSTELNKVNHYYEGDLSGIQAGKVPTWFRFFYKPGGRISKQKDWNQKLEEIADKAHKWDIGFIVGVPAWLQLMMEKIIEKNKVQHIHEVWPNLSVFVHGGVSFEPYRKGFERLLGKPLIYIETYLASEGFIAHQIGPHNRSMKLVLNNGLFYEFVPFNEENFTSDGELVHHPQTLSIEAVQEGVDYALLLSTCAGTWRYLIGDTIRFTDKKNAEIIITGRTKHFLSLCGEHLSVDNMNRAIELASAHFNIGITEFTVSGIPYESTFGHHWFIGTDDQIDSEALALFLDEALKGLNDDYAVERKSALKGFKLNVLPVTAFYDWMRSKGKVGGQNKFPRVLKEAQYNDWTTFISTLSK